jgi:hypothetical protein
LEILKTLQKKKEMSKAISEVQSYSGHHRVKLENLKTPQKENKEMSKAISEVQSYSGHHRVKLENLKSPRKENNKMDAELNKPFEISFRVFRAVGMWQDGHQTWRYFIFGHLLHFIIICLPVLGAITDTVKVEKFTNLVESAGFMIVCFGILSRSLNFLLKLKDMKMLLKSLNSLLTFSADARFKERNEIRKSVAVALKVYKVFWSMAMITCVVAAFVPITTHRFAYPIWMPFKENEIGFWVDAYILVFHGFFIASTAASLTMLPVFFLSFTAGLTNELTTRLSELGKPVKVIQTGPGTSKEIYVKPSAESCKQELLKCIEIHLKIKEFVADLQKVYATPIFLQGIKSSSIICMCIFTMSFVSIENLFIKLN